MKQIRKITLNRKLQQTTKQLFSQIAALIDDRRNKIVRNVNSELTLLNWQIGKYINETLASIDESYGLEIVATLSPLLMNRFGKGYTTSSLHRLHRFYIAFPKLKIVATLSPLLSWSHFIELTNVKDNIARSYYAELCRLEH